MTIDPLAEIEPGGPRSGGISYQELLDTDTRPVPEVLRLQSARRRVMTVDGNEAVTSVMMTSYCCLKPQLN